ncbi:hypothetical protein PLESTB_000501100 [Pleodorina starrii]|uniref:Uncharacterized protein n=1 Tax=Pleodorina starrii TaxID=330485 RepID=A0A9W6BGL5_9CHLO|nr:hypothetical protein PLESTB_000501100 [Pleodorina starrii]
MPRSKDGPPSAGLSLFCPWYTQAQPEGRRARATTRSQAAAAPLPLRPKPASRSRGRSRLGTAGGRLPSSPAAVAGDAVASEAGAALQSADVSPRVQEPAAAAGGTEAPPDLARGVDGELHFPPTAAADEHGAGGAAGAQAADTSPRVQEPAAAAGGTEAPPDLARGVDGELHFPPAAAADEHGAGGAAGAQAADTSPRVQEPAAAAGGTEAPPDLARGVDGELHFPPAAAADEHGAGGAAGAQAADTSPRVQEPAAAVGGTEAPPDLARGVDGELHFPPAAAADEHGAGGAAGAQAADTSPRVQEPAAAVGGTEAPPDLARGVDGELHFPPAAAADEHGAGGAAGAQAADTSPRVQEPAAAAGGTEAPPDLARGVDGELHFPPAAAADEHGAGGAAGAQAADTSPRVQEPAAAAGGTEAPPDLARGVDGELHFPPAAAADEHGAGGAAGAQAADTSPRVQEPAAAVGGTEAPPDLARGVDGELHFPPAAAADEHGAGGAAGAQAADTSPRVQEPAAAAGGTEAPPDLARGVDGELHFPPAAAADEHGAGGAAGAQAADTSPRVQEPAAAAGGTEAPPDLARGVDGELHFPPAAAADEHGAGGAAGAQAADTSPRVQPASRSRGRSRLGTAGGRLPSSPAAVAGDAVASEAGAALQSADASPRVQEPAAAVGGTEAPPDLARGVDGSQSAAQPEGRRARATTRSQAAAAPLPLRPKPASRSRGRSRLGTAGGRLPSSPAAVAGDAVASEAGAALQSADASPRVQEPAAAAGGTEAPPDLARGVDGELHFPPTAAADEHGAGGAAGAQAADTSPRVQEPAAAAGGTEAPPDLARGVDGELHFPPAAAADEHGAGGAAGAQAADTSPRVQPASRSRGRSRLGTAGGRLPSSPAAVAGDAVASEAGAALQSADASPRVQEPAAAAGGTEAPPDLARGVDGELHFPPTAAADEHGAGGAAGAQAADTSPRVQEPAAAVGGTEAPPDLARGVDGELHFPPAAAADEHGAGGAAGAQAADTSPRVQEPAAAAGGTEAPPDLARGVDGELHFPPAAAADEHGAGGAAGAQAADTSPRVQEPAAAAGGTEAPPDLARGVDGELHFPPAAAADEHGAGGAAGAQAADTSPRVQEPAAAVGGTEAPPDLARGVDGELHFPPAAAADEHGAGGAAGAQAADTSPRVQEPAAAAGGTEAPPDLARGVDGELHFPPAAAADEHGAGGAAGAQAADTSPRVQEPAAAVGGTEAPPDLARGVDGELHFPPAAAADEHGAGGAAGAQAADTSPRVQEPAAAAGGTEAPPDLARGVDGELHFPPAAAADEHGAGGAAGAQAADTSPRVQPASRSRGRSRLGTAGGRLPSSPAAVAGDAVASEAGAALQSADASPRVQEPAAAAGGTEAPPDLARGVDGELHFPPTAAADEHGAGGAAGAQAADTSPRVQEPAAAVGGTEAPPDLARGVDGELHFPPAAAADEHGAGGAAGAQAADTSPRVQEPAAAAGGTEAPPDLARGVDGELHFPPTAAADEHGAGGAAGAQAADTSPRVQEPAAAVGGTEAPPDLARGVDGELHFPPAAAADEHGAGGAAGAQAADTSPRVQEPAAAAGGTEAPPDLARGVDGELHFPPAAAADEHGAGGAAGAQAADTSPRVQEPAAAAGGTEAPPDLARGVDGELHFPPAAAADEHGAGGAAGAQAADTSPRVQEPAAATGGTEAPPDLARGVDGELHFPPAAAADEHGAGGAAGAQAADTSPRVQATAGTPAAGVQALLSQLLDSDGVVRLSAIGSNADLLITASYQLVGEVLAPKVLKPASEAIQAVHSRWPHMENRLGGGANGGPGLYGTLACKGISTVFALLVLLTGMCSYSVLVDPGAGLGRALVHAVLLGLRRAWGFELDAGRASQAVGACCKTLCRSFLKSHGKLAARYLASWWPRVQHASVAELPPDCFDGSTHLYTFWEGWTPDDREELAAKVNASKDLKGLAFVQHSEVNMQEYIVDAGFRDLVLVAVCTGLGMSGSGRKFTAYIFKRLPSA